MKTKSNMTKDKEKKISLLIICLLLIFLSCVVVKKVSANYQRLKEVGYMNLWSKTDNTDKYGWSPMWVIYDEVENVNCYVTESAIKCLPATK